MRNQFSSAPLLLDISISVVGVIIFFFLTEMSWSVVTYLRESVKEEEEPMKTAVSLPVTSYTCL